MMNWAKHVIGEAMRKRIETIEHDPFGAGNDDPFFVTDLGEVYRLHLRWQKSLTRVKPFYAVKCNPDPMIIRLLAALGTGFDCSSRREFEQVLGLGVHPSRIIYAQTCKSKSYLRRAAQVGVKQMTFDGIDELYKIKELCPDAELLLRIWTDDTSSRHKLSAKFGAHLDMTEELLVLATRLDLKVVGVSFHIGLVSQDPDAFARALRNARVVFDQAEALGLSLHTLDIGGGFTSENFEAMASIIQQEVDLLYPSHIRIIAEPGRFYASSPFTLVCNVIARRTIRDTATRSMSYMLYLNDGVYGNLANIMYNENPRPELLKVGKLFLYGQDKDKDKSEGQARTEYSIWGPTCDGIDCIARGWIFPGDYVVDVGDWIYFEGMGAYTKALASEFNGFSIHHQVIYVSSEPFSTEILSSQLAEEQKAGQNYHRQLGMVLTQANAA